MTNQRMLRTSRFIHSFSVLLIKKHKLPPRSKFTISMENECVEAFMHGGRGPGGQKINKCNSKVQLKHLPTGVVVSCQETRSREQNRKIAREKLALELDRLKRKEETNSVGYIKTERELALQQWNQQSKKSKSKKSREKHTQHAIEREEQRLKQLQEDEKLIREMINQQ
ncbi:hypothetical protein TPHA_0F02650 [Tetrapisispora phaffii CBS 4417]|uniref:Prokaryotic-type class I peptide chain release factors domain-containing protein n=1 Tax=Tetrapisispora phaffii (strain ATCC 24235 / CBS 4417 / NBRC 1672 / NRRL Y-8282 / UCD 70-5) TaxID=1071381 RepID=G8BUF9_TETPH|nr:hypothetical protein TPHA_0F02650 [Tetrapisispora phaffii CBS 4417]CCE63745.1 hypothetical protein TPHA_0F02650 [Tetrapisispora phaffii CBS 4417]